MALTKCKECGKEVSTDAKACPHCGKDMKKSSILTKKMSGCGCLIIIISALLRYYIISAAVSTPTRRAAPSTSAARIAKEDTLQGVSDILAHNSEKWELVSSYAAIRLVYLSPSESRNKKLISAILYRLARADDGDVSIIRVGFYDDRKHTPSKLPMNDSEMLHWKAQYNLNKNSGLEEFFYNKVVDRAASPPEIKHIAANIRPGLLQ